MGKKEEREGGERRETEQGKGRTAGADPLPALASVFAKRALRSLEKLLMAAAA